MEEQSACIRYNNENSKKIYKQFEFLFVRLTYNVFVDVIKETIFSFKSQRQRFK